MQAEHIAPREGWAVVVCVASGPSFSEAQVATIREAHERGLCKVAVVNDNWRRLPFADLLYACDEEWWSHHCVAINRSNFRGERWTQAHNAAFRYGMHLVAVDARGEGLSRSRERLNGGGNGGYQLVNLMYLFGARKIILVGYDMQPTGGKKHWFGDHPPGLNRLPPFTSWVRRFEVLTKDLIGEGVDLINCSIESALETARRATLGEALCLETRSAA